MIAKRIDMREASKSRASRLAEYVTNELGKAGRVVDVFTVNCLSDDPLIAAKEMEICQARNTRSKDDKTYHLLLSFPDGERPDGERLREIAAAAAEALGYAEHQRIAVVHDDTDNLHMHVIINKIHPHRHTIHTPRNDFKILGELCANLEKSLALQPTNHESTKTRAESKAQDMEKHSGIDSFMHYAREKATYALSAAKSWNEAHKALAAVGITIQARGNGLVLVDQSGGMAIKASSVGREFSKANLEKRLGTFASIDKEQVETLPGAERRTATYSPKPVTASHDLYQQYLAAKHATSEAKTSEFVALWEKQRRLMREVREAGNIRLPAAIGKFRMRSLRRQMREAVKAGISRIRRDMAKLRAEIKAKYKTRSFIEWLKLEAEQGNVPAIYALRKRGAVAPALVNITARDLRDAQIISGKIAHVTGRGTLFYRAGGDIFRDNGSHLSLKKEVSDEGVKAALMIAMAKFGGQPLAVNGSDKLKAKCIEVSAREGMRLAFADPVMEQARRERVRLLERRDVVPEKTREGRTGAEIPSRQAERTNRGMSR